MFYPFQRRYTFLYTFFVSQKQDSVPSEDDVFVMSATNSASTSTARVLSGAEVVTRDEDYTIVDYVEDGNNTRKTILSTSTPRFSGGNDAAALQDLDKLLDTGSTDSSDSGSTSSKSSVKNSNTS